MSNSPATQDVRLGEDSAEKPSRRWYRSESSHQRSIPQWLRQPPNVIYVAVVYLLLVSVYLYVVPPLEGFDSIAHYKYVIHLGQQRQLPEIESAAAEVSYEIPQQPPLYYALSALVTAGSPFERALDYARRVENRYFEMRLSPRWSVSLPDTPNTIALSILASRLVSAFGGLLAVVGTWLLARELIPRPRSFAAAAACIVGLNPLFLFLSSTVTNDTWAIAGVTITLWLVLHSSRQEDFSALRWLLTGCVAGAASLTKYSTLLVAIPSLLVLIRYAKRIGYRKLAYAGLLMIAGGLLTGGFWYFRNLALYEEIVPFRQMTVALPTLLRSTPMSVTEVQDKLPWIFYSYWGVFVGIFAPVRFYGFLKWFVIIGVLGLPIGLILRKDARRPDRPFAILLCFAWLLAAFLSLTTWMRLVGFGDQARLLLIASPAVAVLLVLGWQAFVPRAWHSRLHTAISFLFIFIALWPVPTLAESYAIPKSLPEPISFNRGIMATFDGGMTVLGVDFPQGTTVLQGSELPLTIYFGAENAIPDDYTLFIHLVDGQNDLYAFDGVPYQGRHPTRQWTPGAVFADSYSIVVNPEAPIEDGWLANLTLGFYDLEHGNRVSIFDQRGNPVGDRIVVGPVRILTEPLSIEQVVSSPVAAWENGIGLVSVSCKEIAGTGTLAVDLHWRPSSLVHHDYTVFLQALGENGEVLSQVDREPQGGALPTSVWQPGEIIEDSYELELPASRAKVILGFYDRFSGKRLLLEEPAKGLDSLVLEECKAP